MRRQERLVSATDVIRPDVAVIAWGLATTVSERPKDLRSHAARHPTTTSASHLHSTKCIYTAIVCVRARIKTDPWPNQTVPARKGTTTRAVVAHAQAEAIADGNESISQGLWRAWIWQLAPGRSAARAGTI